MKKNLITFVLTLLITLAMCPAGVLAEGTTTIHTITAWDDPLLDSGMPGVASGDIIVLPTVPAAGKVLSVPAGITSLTVQGRATYSNLSVSLVSGHPGITLTIKDLNMAASSEIDLSGASASSLLIAGSNTIGSRLAVSEGMTLSIDGSGTLNADAGIGGRRSYNGGTIVILGGTITARGQEGDAGIGGGSSPARGADVVIRGGNITAIGGNHVDEDDGSNDSGAGIGGGFGSGNPGTVTIHGGTIVATGGACSAGIGSGCANGSGGVVTINGGDITATGSDGGDKKYGGAGIGNSARCAKSSVVINGGTIRAYGGANAAGIGSGDKSGGVDFTITGGTITAVGGSGIGDIDDVPYDSGGAGIGGGSTAGNGPCSISGGSITAKGGDSSAGIGSGFKSGGMELIMSGGSITATGGKNGAGIGSGIWGGGVALTISNGRINATGGENAQDIGGSGPAGGLQGGYGSLTITSSSPSDTVSIFLRNDNCVTPVLSDGYSHINVTNADGNKVYGVPCSWTGNFGVYLRLCTVTYVANGGNGVPIQFSQQYGTKLMEPAAPTRQGFTFEGWYANETLTTAWNFGKDTVTPNLHLYAKWAGITGIKVGITSLTVKTADYKSITLFWTEALNASGYEIYRSAVNSKHFGLIKKVNGTLTYTDSGLAKGKEYYYKIRPYADVSGTTIYGAFSSVKYAKPAWPSIKLKASAAGYDTIVLSWNSIAGATRYEVLRCDKAKGKYKTIANNVTVTSYTDVGRVAGKTYYYKIKAWDGTAASSPLSGYKSAKTVLSAPAGLMLTKSSPTSITVSWNTVGGAAGYEVYRAASKGGKYKQVMMVTVNSYENIGLTAGKKYYYKVRAYVLTGNAKAYGSYSTIVSAKLD